MSPWVKLDVANELAKNKYVLSCKPNPAIYASPTWDKDEVRKSIIDIIEGGRDCCIEIVMKDISTVNHQPERLKEWVKIAKETVDSYFD